VTRTSRHSTRPERGTPLVEMLQTLHLAHMPLELAVYVALYKDVENASHLKEQLLAGNTDFEYAFIDASMILSTKHVLAATFRAMNDYLCERLKSRNIHSEIVFCLSPNNNIGEAFRRYGVSDTTKSLVVVKVPTDPGITHDSIESHLSEVVKGTPLPFEDSSFNGISDLPKIMKAYKLSQPSLSKGKSSQSAIASSDGLQAPDERHELEVSVIGLMALRGAT
jgi:EKC/KEOPS complex subunit CGI121/TPRKB